MSLFGKIIRTGVNVATLPVAVAKDVFTLGGSMTGRRETYTTTKLQQTKDEAE